MQTEAGKVWWTGLALATAAVGLGLGYLLAAGAPARMIAMNVAAWLVGLAAYATLKVPNWTLGRWRPWRLPALGLVLLATSLAGTPVEGAARWISIGPLIVQLSLVIVPLAIVLFARAPEIGGAAGIGLIAVALAVQPDRAMAGTLAAGLAAITLLRRDAISLGAFGISAVSFVATLAQPDRLPAVPFVDQVFSSSFGVHPLAGAAVLIGAGLLIVPALLGAGDRKGRDAAAAFGAAWLAIPVAAALGNYPTPLVGYGGSAILGYFLSLAVLRQSMAPDRRTSRGARPGRGEEEGGASLSASLG